MMQGSKETSPCYSTGSDAWANYQQDSRNLPSSRASITLPMCRLCPHVHDVCPDSCSPCVYVTLTALCSPPRGDMCSLQIFTKQYNASL